MQQPGKAVIPAAGIGTRLLPATKSQPKEMLPVGRKPTIQYIVEEIYAAGINKILIITSQQKGAIEDHFDLDIALTDRLAKEKKSLEPLEHLELDIELFYTRQSNPTGLADAIGKAEHFVGDEPFIVCLGDAIIQSKSPGSVLKRLIDTFTVKGASAAILFEKVDRQSVQKYGIAAPKGERGAIFEIEDLIEKPSVEDAPSELAIAGRYVFPPIFLIISVKRLLAEEMRFRLRIQSALCYKRGVPSGGANSGRMKNGTTLEITEVILRHFSVLR